ncbi:hypothetical protein MOE50_00960 [Bacillus inaquosorum]|nr:hypothetical protein [Bacillus inaquosorum]MCY9007581.1 hypothetical protein [Bacillus inaquosorum]MCY9037152.1 hypothetical protein [Bacillus inaquosorum]MCY9046856.1 hypothetical protein [Bacillus inaquosorum]
MQKIWKQMYRIVESAGVFGIKKVLTFARVCTFILQDTLPLIIDYWEFI